MNDKITIIMPAYNAELYIKKAIESIIHQTYQNYQLIIINDGSIDSTAEIIDQYESNPSITIIKKINGGIASAYKEAFPLIQGKYIMFLDSDDTFEKNALSEISSNFNSENIDIIQFGINYYTDKWEYKNCIQFEEKEREGNLHIIQEYLYGLLKGNDRPNLGLRAYNKKLFDGFIFPSGSFGIDEILNLYAMAHCNKIKFIAQKLYNCQQRTDSVSRQSANINKVIGQLSIFPTMENILVNYDESIKVLLYLKFIRYYANYAPIITEISNAQNHRIQCKKYYNLIKKHKIKVKIKNRLRIYLFIYLPPLCKISKYITKWRRK